MNRRARFTGTYSLFLSKSVHMPEGLWRPNCGYDAHFLFRILFRAELCVQCFRLSNMRYVLWKMMIESSRWPPLSTLFSHFLPTGVRIHKYNSTPFVDYPCSSLISTRIPRSKLPNQRIKIGVQRKDDLKKSASTTEYIFLQSNRFSKVRRDDNGTGYYYFRSLQLAGLSDSDTI